MVELIVAELVIREGTTTGTRLGSGIAIGVSTSVTSGLFDVTDDANAILVAVTSSDSFSKLDSFELRPTEGNGGSEVDWRGSNKDEWNSGEDEEVGFHVLEISDEGELSSNSEMKVDVDVGVALETSDEDLTTAVVIALQ